MHLLKISRIFEFLFSLLNYNYEFKIPVKKKVLLYNKSSEIVYNFGISKNNTYVIDNKKINLYILFSSILKGNFSYASYIHNYINHINPKIVINYVDNDVNFYLLKKFFSYILLSNQTPKLEIKKNIKEAKKLYI